jgi:hypothetical protein
MALPNPEQPGPDPRPVRVPLRELDDGNDVPLPDTPPRLPFVR